MRKSFQYGGDLTQAFIVAIFDGKMTDFARVDIRNLGSDKIKYIYCCFSFKQKEMFGGEENEKKAIEWISGDIIAH